MNTESKPIEMVDLVSQYERIKSEVDSALLEAVAAAKYINGPQVKAFEKSLAEYMGFKHVVACSNGTDALQVEFIAL